METCVCPSPDELSQLIDGQLPDPEQTRLIQHLDHCEGCQDKLARLADGGKPLPLDTPRPPTDSAFWPALAALQGEESNNAPTRLDPRHRITPDVRLDFLAPAENPGTLGKLGHFDVVGVLGKGGMGLVLHGRDPCLQRDVAVKVLEPSLADNDLAHERFCREARAAASITHENVVAVHSVDEDEHSGLPYLVMQLITGESLEQRINRHRPDPGEVVRIAFQAAAGLAAAHDKGLIHRDIKPGNILIENNTGRVKLTDFGLARATEDARLTRTGFVAGTPLYMSPEQALGKEIDARSDLFSLGVVLYELCTGRPPFTADTPLLVLKRLTEERHEPIRKLNPDVPDWLAELIDQLLSKRPEDRPESAAAVAQELASHLALLDPITPLAVPSSSTAIRRRQVRRRMLPWLVLGAVLLGASVGLLAWYLSGKGTPTPAVPVAVIEAGSGPIWSLAFSPGGETLALALDDGRVRLWERDRGTFGLTLAAHNGPVWSVAIAKSGLMATASDDGTVKLWRPGERQPLHVLEHKNPVRTVAFSRDGQHLLSGSRNGQVRLWDVESGKEVLPFHSGKFIVVSVAISPDGSTAASGGGDKVVRLWDVASGQELLQMPGHTGAVHTVAFSPDGQRVASGSWDHSVRLWGVQSGTAEAVWEGHTQDIWAIAFSPDGKLLASASEDRTVKLWDVAKGEVLRTFTGHTGTLYAVTFSPEGDFVASGGRDGTVRLWRVRE